MITTIICCIIVGVVSSIISAKVIATYYIQIIDSYTTDIIKMIKDLITQANRKDIHR